jgi:hypothetical protein
MWLARDKDDVVYCYTYKPVRNESMKKFLSTSDESSYCQLSEEDFPEITFENSPVELTCTGLSDILATLNNLSETLASDIEQENSILSSCDNTSDILDKTYNYRLGVIQGYAHAQHLISQMFVGKVSEYLKTDKNVNK